MMSFDSFGINCEPLGQIFSELGLPLERGDLRVVLRETEDIAKFVLVMRQKHPNGGWDRLRLSAEMSPAEQGAARRLLASLDRGAENLRRRLLGLDPLPKPGRKAPPIKVGGRSHRNGGIAPPSEKLEYLPKMGDVIAPLDEGAERERAIFDSFYRIDPHFGGIEAGYGRLARTIGFDADHFAPERGISIEVPNYKVGD